MITAVLDTNVLVAGLVGLQTPGSTPGQILRGWFRDEFEIVVSDFILSEVERALAKPYFTRQFSPEQARNALQLLRRRATEVEITTLVRGAASHREDDLVIATALSAASPYLVTGDKELLAISQYKGVAIVTPTRFLAVIRTAG